MHRIFDWNGQNAKQVLIHAAQALEPSILICKI